MQLSDLLKACVAQKASDLHLSPGLPPMLRISGELEPLADKPALKAEEIKTLVYHAMDTEQQQTFEKEFELDFATELPSVARFRVNAFHQMNGIAAVFRVIPEKTPTLEELNLPNQFKRLLELPNGLILVTGPTGSGKSTTLAAMVDYINSTQNCHIITIEDPIEFTHQSKKKCH